MSGAPTGGCPAFVTDRRRLLMGLAGSAAAASIAGLGAARAAEVEVADTPHSEAARWSQPFHGLHQSGVVTPRPAAGMVVAFDTLAQSPDEVERLFRTLTERDPPPLKWSDLKYGFESLKEDGYGKTPQARRDCREAAAG